MDTKRKIIVIFSTLLILLLGVSCDLFEDKSNGVGSVKFVAPQKGVTKSLSTGDGVNAVPFSELTSHKIKLECTEGTGYCNLLGAKDGYVAWPESNVSLGYGTWKVLAEGYKDNKKYYENTDGVTFIVGPKGVSVNDGLTWGSSVSIKESYCGSTEVQIKANTSLDVKDEAGATVSLQSDGYNAYTVKWYRTTTASPTDLDKVRKISELTGDGRSFTEWTEPGTAIDLGSYTYVAAVIVKTSNPDTIYGMVAVPLANLTAGSTYTIGSGSGDCVQFGKYGVSFSHIERIKIRVLNYMDSSNPNTARECEEVWDRFTELHPEIEVVREDLFNEPFHQKVEAYAAQGNMPDVVYAWPSGRSATLHTEGLLMDLRPLLERDDLTDKYIQATLANQMGGYLGELPNGLTATSLMYVNKEVLDKYGLSIPKTYAELKKCAGVLAANGIECVAMDCKDGWVMQSCLFSLICGRFGGADWYDKLTKGETYFTDQWFVNALTVIDNLYEDGIINRNTLLRTYQSSVGDFATGKAAFFIDGDWSTSQFMENPGTGGALIDRERQENGFIMMNFPALDGEVIHNSNSAVAGTGWGMRADLEGAKMEAAWTLIKFLESEEIQEFNLLTGASFPSLLSVDVDKVCEENGLEPFVAKRTKWYRSIQVSTPVIDSVLQPAVYEVINTVLAEIGQGSITPTEGATRVQTAWNSLMPSNL